MRKIFRHDLIVKLLAFLVLTLAVITFSAPKIERYNSEVEDAQKKLLITANGNSNGVISFSSGDPKELSPFYYAEIAVLVGLFVSLILTRKIFLSLLSAGLFVFEFFVLHELFVSNVEFPYSYFYNYPLYAALFVFILLALSHWQASIICRLGRQMFLSPKNLK